MYWITGTAGFALALTPWIFGYANNEVALWTSFFVGVATFIVSWIEGTKGDRERWEYWTSVILGIVAIGSPFIFGFNTSVSALWSIEILGILVLLFAGGRLFTFGNKQT